MCRYVTAPKSTKSRTLADIILEKIAEKEAGRGGGGGGGGGMGDDMDDMAVPEGIDEKVVEVYRQVGDLLRRYTVGKVPKAFKIPQGTQSAKMEARVSQTTALGNRSDLKGAGGRGRSP